MSILRDVTGPLGAYNNVLDTGEGGRKSAYGDSYGVNVSSKEWIAADEGTYFFAQNPTPGTGIIGPVSTTFDETKAVLAVYNGGSTKRIYLQFLRLYITTAGSSDTRVQFTHAVDTGNRYSSGGSTLTVVNPNMDSNTVSLATVKFGAITTTAASGSRRLLGTTVFRGTIGIIEDCYEFVYAASDGSGMGGSRAATVQDMARLLAPVAIGPGQSYLIHDWAGSIATGRTYAVEFGYIER